MSVYANVYEALLAFHGESPALQKTKLNPAFKSKYIALEHLIAEVTPLLTKHGLIWATYPETADGEPCLRYELVHAKTDTRIGSRMALQSKGNLPQDQGSATTYARRYSMMAVLNLAADEDDDGNRASKARAARPTPAPTNGNDAKPADRSLSVAERERVIKAVKDSGRSVPMILTAAGVEDSNAMTAGDAKNIKAVLDEFAKA